MILRCLLPLLAVAALPGANAPTPPPAAKPPGIIQPAGASVNPLAQDLVVLDNKQSIAGTVIPHTPDDGFVDINTGSGKLRIRSERIKSIVLGLNSQRQRLDAKDFASLTAFARWCIAHGLFDDALGALDQAVQLPECDVETRGLRATLVDQSPSRGPRQALPLYRQYKADGGTDAKIIARLQELEDALAAHNEELRKIGAAPVEITATSPNPAPQPAVASGGSGPAPGKEGLETKGWQTEDLQWSLPSDTKVTTLPAEEGGQKVLEIASTGKPATPPAPGAKVPDKVAIKKGVNYAVDENSVLSVFAENRTDHPVKLALAVKTGKDWTFYESTQQAIAPGADFKELRFNLKANTFKSAASKWQNNGSISDLDQVKELQVLIYNDKADVDLLLRGMTFLKDSEM